VLALAAIAVLLHQLAGGDGFDLVGEATGEWAYLAVFGLVFGDAICALLPGETTLNAAATLAASGSLQLGLVILAGALGAIVGDSAVYWIARTGGRRIRPQVDRATRNARIAAALEFIGSSAPILLVAGRYVPGLRLVVNATMGFSQYPYRRFLVWSSIGGALWSAYTCGLAYVVATALAGFPLASVVISGAITTVAIAALFVVMRRRRAAAAPGSPGPGEAGAPAAPPA
jgi:membrane-associated protein